MTQQDSHTHLWPGVPLALGSAVLFGATPPLSKLLLQNTQPFMLAGLLYLGAGLGLALYNLLRRGAGQAQEAGLTRKDMPWLALAIVLGGIVAPVLLMWGLALTTASAGSLLLNLEGLATLGIAWLVYKESVDRRLLFGAIAILAGATLLSWTGEGVSINPGAALVVLACVAWGLDNNFTRKISAADPAAIATAKGLVAGSVNVAIALAMGGSLPAHQTIMFAAILGVFGIGVSLVMFILALRHLGTARTGAYYALAPFIGGVIAVALLSEPLTLTLALAGGLMALGLYLHLSERHEHEHQHDVLEHEHMHVHDAHHQHAHHSSVAEAHSHIHRHEPMRHKHPHFPDLHHRHGH